MDVLNRLMASVILLVILLLALGALGIATGLLTVQAVDSVSSYGPLHLALKDFHTAHPTEALIRKVLVAAGTAILACLLLLSELTPPRSERSLRLEGEPGSEVIVARRAVGKIAEFASMSIAGVRRARCEIHHAKTALRVQCRIAIDRHANAKAIGSQVEEVIKQQLEQAPGRPVDQVSVWVELQYTDGPARVR